jgi:hypothetical protein
LHELTIKVNPLRSGQHYKEKFVVGALQAVGSLVALLPLEDVAGEFALGNGAAHQRAVRSGFRQLLYHLERCALEAFEEVEEVLLVLPDEPSPVMSRELVYTGITRAMKRVEIWGSESVFTDAVEHRLVRASGLQERLWAAAD